MNNELLTELFVAAQQTELTVQKKNNFLQLGNIVVLLAKAIENQTYLPSSYTCFAITDPTPREILAPSFPDRIVHRWLVNKLEPYIDKRFLPCSYANRKGKGHHRAVKQLQFYLNNSANAFYLKMDIESFFNSIDHAVLIKLMFRWLTRSVIPSETRNLSEARNPSETRNLTYDESQILRHVCETIITYNPTKNVGYTGNKEKLKLIPKSKSYFNNPEGRGLPLGNLSSQFFANIYLHELDFFVKHKLKIKYYLRYVDDFVLLATHKEQLKQWRTLLERFLQEELKLTMHPKKIMLQPVSHGIDFLGYIVNRRHLLVRQRTVKSLKRKLYFFNHIFQPKKFPHRTIEGNGQIAKLYRENKLSWPMQPVPKLFTYMQCCLNSYYGVFRFADSYRLRKDVYNNHFCHLQKFFYGAKWFEKIGVIKTSHLKTFYTFAKTLSPVGKVPTG